MSNYTLDKHELSLLDKGLTFIPTVCRTPHSFISECQTRNIRNLKLRDYFRNKADGYDPELFQNRFIKRSEWEPKMSKLSEEAIEAIASISDATAQAASKISPTANPSNKINLTAEERNALIRLKNNEKIVIKPADKGGAVVIMDKEAYKAEAYRQLNNEFYYKPIERPLANKTAPKINKIISDLQCTGCISDKQAEYLWAKPPTHPRPFYLLPKIHKDEFKWPQKTMPEGRPIVSDSGSETEKIAEFIDYFLKPIATDSDTYLKDTYDFINKIRGQQIPHNAFIVTGDVTALYTNMHIDESLKRVEEEFLTHPDPRRNDKAILDLLDLSLRNNDFMFDDRFFVQNCGTAMGKRYAPNLANIYLRKFDEQAKNGFTIKPLIFFRYIDDLFFIWTGTLEQLKEYERFLNSLIQGIKVTLNVSPQTVNFLDTTVYKNRAPNGDTVLHTKVFFKPTDTHQLLHGRSFHPRHTTKGILKSQILRFKRISTHKCEFDHACRTLFNVLKNRGYSRTLFRKTVREIWSNDWTPRATPPAGQIWPIINYFDQAGTQIMKATSIAIKNMKLSENFTIVQAYKRHKNLKEILVRSAFCSPKTTKSCKARGCLSCKAIETENFFKSWVTNRKYPIPYPMDCNSRAVIYLITCSKCKIQYVGQTERRLKDRLNAHRSYMKNKLQTKATGLHFSTPGHEPQHLRIIPIEIQQDKNRRLEREKFWMNILQSNYPHGLNNYPIDYSQTNFASPPPPSPPSHPANPLMPAPT